MGLYIEECRLPCGRTVGKIPTSRYCVLLGNIIILHPNFNIIRQ